MADVTARSLQYEYKAVRVGPGRTPGREFSGERETEEGSLFVGLQKNYESGGEVGSECCPLSASLAPLQISPSSCPAVIMGSVRIGQLIKLLFAHVQLYDAVSF